MEKGSASIFTGYCGTTVGDVNIGVEARSHGKKHVHRALPWRSGAAALQPGA
jgi:hypothetical protein